MKDCMMMQALMNKQKLLVPDTEKPPRRYEHLECGQPAGKAVFPANGPYVPTQPVHEIWQFL
jgi:hypothetical protein